MNDTATTEQLQDALNTPLERVLEAADGSSNDEHIAALNDALDTALRLLGVEWPEADDTSPEYETADHDLRTSHEEHAHHWGEDA